MQYERHKPYIKWGVYYFILILLFALQTVPSFLSIMGVKPVLVIPFMICVCMFEEVMPSTAFAIITGLIWDVTSQKLLGFNAIILLFAGMMISVVCIYYLHTRLLNSLVFCLVTVLVQGLLDYLFHFGMWRIDGASDILLKSILPTAGYTVVFAIPFYFLARSISRRFNDVTRV